MYSFSPKKYHFCSPRQTTNITVIFLFLPLSLVQLIYLISNIKYFQHLFSFCHFWSCEVNLVRSKFSGGNVNTALFNLSIIHESNRRFSGIANDLIPKPTANSRFSPHVSTVEKLTRLSPISRSYIYEYIKQKLWRKYEGSFSCSRFFMFRGLILKKYPRVAVNQMSGLEGLW